MKKPTRLISLTALFLFIYSSSYANTFSSNSKSNNFDTEIVSDFNEAEIYNAFTEINDLISFISENDSATYSDIKTQDPSLLLLHDTDSNNAINLTQNFSFNNQTAFITGCAFGVFGILAVAIINNGNTSVINSSIWGCVASGCISVGGVIAFYVFYFATFSGVYY